jgi:hypothetical protein
MPEDMQDYLARMNKQLEEMAAQHLQVRSYPLLVDAVVASAQCAAQHSSAQRTRCLGLFCCHLGFGPVYSC